MILKDFLRVSNPKNDLVLFEDIIDSNKTKEIQSKTSINQILNNSSEALLHREISSIDLVGITIPRFGHYKITLK